MLNDQKKILQPGQSLVGLQRLDACPCRAEGRNFIDVQHSQRSTIAKEAIKLKIYRVQSALARISM